MIYTFVPYSPGDAPTDLGKAYNDLMALLPRDDDWACFIDHDAMFTTRHWYGQLTRIVQQHPAAGCFTAMTNRVANPNQVHGFDWNHLKTCTATTHRQLAILDRHHGNHDIACHRRIGAALSERYDSDVVPLGHLMSGVVILTRKSVWKEVGFVSGFLGVDWEYHRGCVRKGYGVYLMRGVYVYHWYRGDGDLSHVDPQVRKE